MLTATATHIKTHLSTWLDEVEHHHETVEIIRHGQVVARLTPVVSPPQWQSLRGKGRLVGKPGDSVVSADDFEALS